MTVARSVRLSEAKHLLVRQNGLRAVCPEAGRAHSGNPMKVRCCLSPSGSSNQEARDSQGYCLGAARGDLGIDLTVIGKEKASHGQERRAIERPMGQVLEITECFEVDL
jgi:hypothetical protein